MTTKTSLRRLLCLVIAGGLLAVGAGAARAGLDRTRARHTVAPSGPALRRGGVQPRPPLARDQGVGPGGERVPARHGASPELSRGVERAGYALRHVGRYADSVAAYEQALRLRPAFPEALEYLGEAYVMMGRPDDARRVLDRLKPLDAARAKELAEAIDKGR